MSSINSPDTRERVAMRMYYELMIAGHEFRLTLSAFRTQIAALGGGARVREAHLSLAVDCKPEQRAEVERIAMALGFLEDPLKP